MTKISLKNTAEVAVTQAKFLGIPVTSKSLADKIFNKMEEEKIIQYSIKIGIRCYIFVRDAQDDHTVITVGEFL